MQLLTHGFDLLSIASLFRGVDVEKAECFDKGHEALIRGIIQRKFGRRKPGRESPEDPFGSDGLAAMTTELQVKLGEIIVTQLGGGAPGERASNQTEPDKG